MIGMSSTALSLYLIIMLLLVLGIAWLMEKTKHIFVKNGNPHLYRILASVYVALALLVLGLTGIYQPLLCNILGAYRWVDLVAHFIILWSLQAFCDLYLVKKLLKATIENVARKNGASEEMIRTGEELIGLGGKEETKDGKLQKLQD
mgnify:CR=1 FL=1